MATADSIQKAAQEMQAQQKIFEAHLGGAGTGSGGGWSQELSCSLLLAFSSLLSSH